MSDSKLISELFESNYRILTNEFPAHEGTLLPHVCAAYFTSKQRSIDPDVLGNNCFLLKDLCGPYPALSGKWLLVSASILSTQERDVESRLGDLSEICRKLNGHRESAGVTPSAVFLAQESANPLEWKGLHSSVSNLRELAGSSFPTLGEIDVPLSVAAVLSGDSPENVLSDAAGCLELLNSSFREKADHRRAALMLALCKGSPEEKTAALKGYTERLSAESAFASPSFLPVYVSLLCSGGNESSPKRIAGISRELKKKKGFGMFSLSAGNRLALCALASQPHSSYTQELLALDHLCRTLK